MTHPLYQVRHPGTGPFEEVWFLEIVLGPGEGLWVRYTLEDGVIQERGVWAVAFQGERAVGDRRAEPLALPRGGRLFEGSHGTLLPDRATGAVDGIAWDLRLRDQGRRHTFVPPMLARLGRTYAPAAIDLRCDGHVVIDGRRRPVEDARGVLGHIHGRRNRVGSWTWAHTNLFPDAPDGVFELLSASLGPGRWRTPPLTTMALWVDGKKWSFSSLSDLVGTRVQRHGDALRFQAGRGPVTLEGEVALPRAPVALARYLDPSGQPLWCRNSRFGRVHLYIRDRAAGVDRELVSEQAAVEHAARHDPGGSSTVSAPWPSSSTSSSERQP